MSVFVDTSVWYAAIDRADRSHQRAAEIVSDIDHAVTTDHVLIETHRLADHRMGRTTADAFLSTVLGGAADVEVAGRSDLDAAFRIRSEFRDQDFSLVDCTSFVIMERLRIATAATLDIDFTIYRFGPLRRLSFQVIN